MKVASGSAPSPFPSLASPRPSIPPSLALLPLPSRLPPSQIRPGPPSTSLSLSLVSYRATDTGLVVLRCCGVPGAAPGTQGQVATGAEVKDSAIEVVQLKFLQKSNDEQVHP